MTGSKRSDGGVLLQKQRVSFLPGNFQTDCSSSVAAFEWPSFPEKHSSDYWKGSKGCIMTISGRLGIDSKVLLQKEDGGAKERGSSVPSQLLAPDGIFFREA